MIGSSLALVDMSGVFGGFSDLPDDTAHVLTLQLQNQDGFSSQYGYRGTDYDYRILVRNLTESPKAGSPRITRHNAEFQLTKRATISAGVVTPAVPYVVGLTMRFPETGTSALMTSLTADLVGALCTSNGAKLLKMMNFES